MCEMYNHFITTTFLVLIITKKINLAITVIYQLSTKSLTPISKMMNRTLTVSCNIGVRFISTANASKNVEAATITAETSKEAYYKNLGASFGVEDNTKPAGWDEALPYKSIPGPKPLPIIGNVWRFFPHIGDLHNVDVLDMHKR